MSAPKKLLLLEMPDGRRLGFILLAAAAEGPDGTWSGDCVFMPLPTDPSLLESAQHAWLSSRHHAVAGEHRWHLDADAALLVTKDAFTLRFEPAVDGRLRAGTDNAPFFARWG